MRTLPILALSILIFSCANKRKKNAAIAKSWQFKYEITLCTLDTSDLESSFWKINRQLEKLHPERFSNPPQSTDTANIYYVTHLLKKHTLTYGGVQQLSVGLPLYAVSKTDTAELNKFLYDPSYKGFFPANAHFMYGVETSKNNGYLDLFCVSEPSVHFKKADFGKVNMTFGIEGQYVIAVELNEEAGRKLKSFTAMNVNRQIGILINGAVYAAPRFNGPITSNYFEIDPKMTKEEISSLFDKY